MDELKPCPFCGGDRVKVTKPTMWQAWCMDCKAIGAARLTEQEAAEAWNTRASGWIPCSERTPEIAGGSVIVHAKNCYGQNAEFIAFQGYGDFKWHTMDAGYMDHTQPGQVVSKAWEITHWMPLPEPPGMEDNDG